MVRVDFVNPFILAASEVIRDAVGCGLVRGTLRMESSKVASEDITVVVGVTGDAAGIVLYGMSERTAKNIASLMLGQRVPVFDTLAESAVAELGNMIAGRAASRLEAQSYVCRLTPPTLLQGRGTVISLIDINRLVVPLNSEPGTVEISIALRDNRR